MNNPTSFRSLIASNRGRLVSALTALVVGAITNFVVSRGGTVSPDNALLLSGFFAALTGWLIDNLAARINSTGIEQIQKALPGVKDDGYAGSKTLFAVERLVDNSQDRADGSDQGLPVSFEEIREMKDKLSTILRKSPPLAAELRKYLADAA